MNIILFETAFRDSRTNYFYSCGGPEGAISQKGGGDKISVHELTGRMNEIYSVYYLNYAKYAKYFLIITGILTL